MMMIMIKLRKYFSILILESLEKGIQPDNISLHFYHLAFSDYCLHFYCYFHNVSVDMSSGLLQVFVELGNLHGTSNYVLY